ncbi:hypothetical protein TRAPUB_12414, partial [Trametes pubescens]
MSDPQSGRKRQRTVSHTAKDNTSGSAAKLLVKRDDEFWFEDGNIVLIARDIEFRVFKGILAKHSPLFRDICRAHALHANQAEVSSYSAFAANSRISFKLVSGALAVARMSHKYQMHDMLALAVQHLKRAFPDTFHEQVEKPLCCIPSPSSGALAIGAVNLARLIDEPSLLPTALYACCALKSADLLKGLVHEDGSVEHLALEDLGRCLDACGRLAEKILVLATRIFELSVSKECAAQDTCREALEMMLSGVGQDSDMFADPDVLSPWMDA